ncbi:MAG: hypothetical protein N2689_08780 [Verrucomicrobiae bacterium]|nr:hypothetical protein [Verrucomicrobiae bacterium]
MLTGKPLGAMIATAIKRKNVKQVDVARRFDVKPPSVSSWVATGRIDKEKLSALWRYFSDVTVPQEWGLESWPWLDLPNDHSSHMRSSEPAPPALPPDVGALLEELEKRIGKQPEAVRKAIAGLVSEYLTKPEGEREPLARAIERMIGN